LPANEDGIFRRDSLIFERVRQRLFARTCLAPSPSFVDELSFQPFALIQIVWVELDAKPPEFCCSATPIDAVVLTVAAKHVVAVESL
jgi:hypothetical protein